MLFIILDFSYEFCDQICEHFSRQWRFFWCICCFFVYLVEKFCSSTGCCCCNFFRLVCEFMNFEPSKSGRWIMYFEQRRHWTFGIGVVLMWRTKFPSTLCRRAMCSRRIFINNLYSRHSTQRICQHSRRVWFGWSSWSAVFTAKPFQLFPVRKRASPAPSCRLNWIGHHWVLAILNSRFLHFFKISTFFRIQLQLLPSIHTKVSHLSLHMLVYYK